MTATVEVEKRPTLSVKPVVRTLFALTPLVLSACGVSETPIQPIPNSSVTNTNPEAQPVDPSPTATQTPEPGATPTVEINRNLPTQFNNIFFGGDPENTNIPYVGGVSGDVFERLNPGGCVVPTVNGNHETRINTLYSGSAPNDTVAFMIENNFLMNYFQASTNKDGRTLGTLPNGTQVELIDNVWQAQINGQTMFFNPVVSSLAHPFGTPVLCKQNNQLMTTLVESSENPTIVSGSSIQPAFRTASQIANEYGYTGTGTPASVGVRTDGRLEVRDSGGRPLAYLRFLGGETQVLPALPENVWSLPIVNSDHSGFENITPTFDEGFMGGTWVWRDQRGDVRRYLDPETNHLFARGQSDWDRVIVDVDLNFGYEPLARSYENYSINSMTSFSAVVFRSIAGTFGQDYLTQLGVIQTNPESLYGYSSWLVYRIVQGGQSNIQNQNQINNAEGNNIYLEPHYNNNSDQFVFTLYINGSWTGGQQGLREYTNNMYWHCLPNYSGTQYPEPFAINSARLP